MIAALWKAIDRLQEEGLTLPEIGNEPVQLERSLCFQLYHALQRLRLTDVPFYPCYEPHEFESIKGGKAEPPQPDLSFHFYESPIELNWPIEAKVLKDAKDTALYLEEISKNLLTCRYAPFSGEAAMLGFLLKDIAALVFADIERKLRCKLEPGSSNPPRDHMISKHVRQVPEGKPYGTRLLCHHLVVRVSLESAEAHLPRTDAA